MDRISKQDLSRNEVIDLLRGMDAQEVEDNFSVRRVLIDTQACDVFGGDPYPFFERICESIMNDGNKCQTLQKWRWCHYDFHAQQVRVAKNVLRHFPGHTMLNHLNGRIMQDRKSQKNFERALMHEMEKIKIAARQWHWQQC